MNIENSIQKAKKLPIKLNLTRIDTPEQLRIIGLGWLEQLGKILLDKLFVGKSPQTGTKFALYPDMVKKIC